MSAARIAWELSAALIAERLTNRGKGLEMEISRNQNGYRVGEGHQKAKLTDEQVREMRTIHEAGGMGYRKLPRLFGCGESTARDICTYRTRYANTL